MNKRTCEKCSKLFDHSGRGAPTRCPGCRHGRPTDYKRGCRCQKCRGANSEAMREYTEQRKTQGRPLHKSRRRSTRSIECEQCGEDFETTEWFRQRFCSQACYGRSNRSRPTDLVHVGPRPVEWGYAPAVPVTVVTLPKWWGVITNGPCAWCGETFTATSGAARFCSDGCSRGHHKSKRGFHPSPILRRAIYERDGWTCQLCFEPVETSGPGEYNPWAPSLDHIAPQSHMLVPDHSPENLRTAHVWCNAVRGDGTYHADFFEEAS